MVVLTYLRTSLNDFQTSWKNRIFEFFENRKEFVKLDVSAVYVALVAKNFSGDLFPDPVFVNSPLFITKVIG